MANDTCKNITRGEAKTLMDRRVAEEAALMAENAALRKRVAELEQNTYLGLLPPQWPTPQPIETAPLGETVLVWNSIASEWAPSAHHRKSDTHWLPMPPPHTKEVR
jgi:hypothetical protein